MKPALPIYETGLKGQEINTPRERVSTSDPLKLGYLLDSEASHSRAQPRGKMIHFLVISRDSVGKTFRQGAGGQSAGLHRVTC